MRLIKSISVECIFRRLHGEGSKFNLVGKGKRAELSFE
jgi:hypothetical protein